MGGNAIKEARPLQQDELRPTYEWVEQNVLPLLGLTKRDAIPTGSFCKKKQGETSGDIDVSFKAKKFLDEGLKFEEVATSINLILIGEGFETKLVKGFDLVSIKVPIKGDEKNGYAQVDLIPTTDLKWAKFMYHSPNLGEGESKYKGAVRNSLLMAIVSESTKENLKLFENQIAEYKSLAIRFPTGVWNMKRSFVGKKGEIIKTSKVIESKFVTNNPQDVIDLILGKGYKVDAANSFETLWEIIHRKDFVHKDKINEILSKFKVNLDSMKQNVPEEALKKYPNILNEDIRDILKPRDEKDILADVTKKLQEIPPKSYSSFYDTFFYVISSELREKIDKKILEDAAIYILNNTSNFDKSYKRISQYISLPKEKIDEVILKMKFNKLCRNYHNANRYSPPKTNKEFLNIEKEVKFNKKKENFEKQIKLLRGSMPYKSIHRIVQERTERGQFEFIYEIFRIFRERRSYHVNDYAECIYRFLDGKIKEIPRSKFLIPVADDQWGLEWVDSMVKRGMLNRFKKRNKIFLELNLDFGSDIEFVKKNYWLFIQFLTNDINKYGLTELNEGIN